MNLWILDTDMLTLWLRGQEIIAARVAATPLQQLAVTIITLSVQCVTLAPPKRSLCSQLMTKFGTAKSY